jgi:hypothetical protein
LGKYTPTCPPAISNKRTGSGQWTPLTRFVNLRKTTFTHSVLQALSKNPTNSKALFRKAKALGELGYFEKAEAVLNEVKKVAPNGGSCLDSLPEYSAD